ncbi:hypothetical protein M3J07_009872 [Ascochyta lentis]
MITDRKQRNLHLERYLNSKSANGVSPSFSHSHTVNAVVARLVPKLYAINVCLDPTASVTTYLVWSDFASPLSAASGTAARLVGSFRIHAEASSSEIV